MIELTCTDQQPHPSDHVTLNWQLYWSQSCVEPNWQPIDSGSETDGNVQLTNLEDSCHKLVYYCADILGNTEDTQVEIDAVDNKYPLVHKDVGQFKYPYSGAPFMYIEAYDVEDAPVYVTQGTPITLTCEDQNPHPVDQVKIYYKYYVDGIINDTQGEDWTLYGGQFTYPEDTYHELYYYCIDKLGNKGPTHVEMDIVDTQKPQTVKTITGPQFNGQGNIHKYITKDSVIDLTCTDPQPHPVDHVTLNWKLYWSQNCVEPLWTQIGSGSETDGNVQLTNLEDSCHKLVYYCVDALNNIESTQEEIDAVDNQAPNGTKNVGNPAIPCIQMPPVDGPGLTMTVAPQPDCYWVRDHVTNITLDCTDAQPHPIGGEVMCYQIKFDGETSDLTQQYCTQFGGKMEDGWCCADVAGEKSYKFDFQEDSVHTLEYYCKDAFNNQNLKDLETFKVDSVPPTTIKTYINPFYVDPQTGYHYIDTASRVNLTATDGGAICHVEGMTTYYWYTVVPDNYCTGACAPMEHKEWSVYSEPFGIPEESCHLIEFYSVDALGNKEQKHYQCVFVDKKAPVTTKSYGTPRYPNDALHPKWINSSTDITLTAVDQTPHPSGVKELNYRVTLVDKDYCENTELCLRGVPGLDKAYDKASPLLYGVDGSASYTFRIPDDSCHMIEYYSVDNVGKTEPVRRQCVYVDNLPPNSTKTFDGFNMTCDQLPCKSAGDCNYYINKDTKIVLSCTDQNPHPVDQVKIMYRYFLDDVINATQGKDWTLYDPQNPIQYNEDSKHTLEWYCEDALGNRETTHTQVERVDTTPPTTVKTFSGPTYPLDEANPNYWVTSDTAITLTTTDGGPICAAGPATLYYQVWWDSNCDGTVDTKQVDSHVHTDANCNLNKTLYLQKECLHEIKWHAVDALGNVETEHVQFHKVDNTPPHVLILKPVDGWYSDGEDIAIVTEAEDLNNVNSSCEQRGGVCDVIGIGISCGNPNDCNGLGTNCAVGIAEDAQCYAYLVDVERTIDNIRDKKIQQIMIENMSLDTDGTLLYNKATKQCEGYATIPAESGLEDGIKILVVGVADNLHNYADSLDEIGRAINERCGCDVFDMCDSECVRDALQDIVLIWNLPKIGIDNHAPVVEITAPSENSLFGGEQVYVSAEVSDSESGQVTSTITSGTPCYITLGGVSMGSVPYQNDARKCAGTIMIPEDNDFPQGTQSLEVSVADNAGNIGSDSINVNVDTTKPEIYVDYPDENMFVKGTVGVEIVVRDSNLPGEPTSSDPKDLHEYVEVSTDNGQTWEVTENCAYWGVGHYKCTYSWDTTSETDGMAYGIVAQNDRPCRQHADTPRPCS